MASARIAALVIGLGGAFVAKIGYLAGRAAPSLASPRFVRRRSVRHNSYLPLSSRSREVRRGDLTGTLQRKHDKGKRLTDRKNSDPLDRAACFS